MYIIMGMGVGLFLLADVWHIDSESNSCSTPTAVTVHQLPNSTHSEATFWQKRLANILTIDAIHERPFHTHVTAIPHLKEFI